MTDPKIYEKEGMVYFDRGVKEEGIGGIRLNLTLMFGKGNEPRTVEELERLFPQPQEYKL